MPFCIHDFPESAAVSDLDLSIQSHGVHVLLENLPQSHAFAVGLDQNLWLELIPIGQLSQAVSVHIYHPGLV